MRRFLARRVLAAAYLALASTTAGFAQDHPACEGPEVEDLAELLPQARRYVVAAELVAPLLRIWPLGPELAGHLRPDGATVLAPGGSVLLVALTRGRCVVGAYEADRALLWRRLREALGPAI